MNDENSGRIQRRQRRAAGRHRAPRKGTVFKPALWAGIAVCLLASAAFLAGNRSRPDTIAVSAIKLSAGEGADNAEQSGSIFEDSLIDPRLILGTELPVIYGVELEEINPQESKDASEPPEINFDVIPEEIKMEILRFSTEPQEFSVGAQGPQILIYHTHTQEAYTPTEEDAYIETGSWRTSDETHSVVAVGEVLKTELEGYGFSVIHDTTDHEPPKLSTAYSRSLTTMLAYRQKYPSLRLFIDLHRDASSDTEDYVKVDGMECARMMFVVGTGENYEGDEKPNYETNFKLAQALTDELDSMCEGIMRPIRVKPGRYNQQVSDMCLLIEVGHNANTLQQAKNAVQYFALALSRVVDIGG
jgi:stage II sporulation protein P